VPQSEVIFYKEGQSVPIRDWLKKQPAKIQIKCLAYLAQLETKGHELRRPAADFLRDGIYELRPSYQGVNYRILYFFAGKNIVVVSHGLKKESGVPAVEIGRAMERKAKFEGDPSAHTYRSVR
jgi:hypothetical protein